MPAQRRNSNSFRRKKYTTTPDVHYHPSTSSNTPIETIPTTPSFSEPCLAENRWKYAADRVKVAVRHAWNSYKDHAWGFDEIKPLSKKGIQWLGGVGATLIDSMSTLWLIGEHEEFYIAEDWLENHYNRTAKLVSNTHTSVFELVIRGLAGLLSAHALSGRQVLLDRAVELGTALLPAYSTKSGMPYSHIDLETRMVPHPVKTRRVNLAEVGSVSLEFAQLAKAARDANYPARVVDKFEQIAWDTLDGIEKAAWNSPTVAETWPLVPIHFSPVGDRAPTSIESDLSFGAMADSYYETLLKRYLQSKDPHYFQLWLGVIHAMQHKLTIPLSGMRNGQQLSGVVLIKIKDNQHKEYNVEHLSCFAGGLVALGAMVVGNDDDARALAESVNLGAEDLTHLAGNLTNGCLILYGATHSGLGPENTFIDPQTNKIGDMTGSVYLLRPELVESLFYMYQLTGQDHWREQGELILDSLETYTQVSGGFASIETMYKGYVGYDPVRHKDEMPSYFIAETLKYLYLLFIDDYDTPPDDRVLDLNRWVLTTEAHPLPI